jgi:hypothetical protein
MKGLYTVKQPVWMSDVVTGKPPQHHSTLGSAKNLTLFTFKIKVMSSQECHHSIPQLLQPKM